jgi:hypothetical protein
MNDEVEETDLPTKEKVAILAKLLYGDFYARWKTVRIIFLILSLVAFSLYAFTDFLVVLVAGVICAILSLYLQAQINIANKKAAGILNKERSSSNETEAVNFENEYSLRLVKSLGLNIDDKAYALSVKHESEDWEDDDICLANDGAKDFAFHPRAFHSYMQNAKNEYLKSQASDFIQSVRSAKWLKLHYMDDSRSYSDISVDGEIKSIPAHYSSIDSYLGMVEGKIYVISSNFVDSEQNELSEVITKIDKNLWSRDSAQFSEEEGIWAFVEDA